MSRTSLQKSPQKYRTGPLSLDPQRPLITILGPTAVGKSGLALRLAERHGGEIICADSRTIYRGMDKGTAKPSASDRARVPHHLLDVCNPDERFSAQEFVTHAASALEDIWSRSNTAFVVGGSGLYIDALLFGYKFRSKTQDEDLSEFSLHQLQARAKSLYPAALERIDAQNRRRVEQLILRGPASSADRDEISLPGPIFGLDKDDDVLKTTIAWRTEAMLASGWAQEVAELIEMYGPAAPGLATTGYRELAAHLSHGVASQEEAINRATWRLVRKQRTWFRRNPFITWLPEDEIFSQVDELLPARSGTIDT